MASSTYDFKTALVTGGGGSIGKAISQQLIKDGKKVIIVGRTESNFKSTAKEIGATAYYKLLSEHPDVDCLINNAGVQRPLDVNSDDPKELLQNADQEININIRGLMHLNVELLQHLKSKSNALVVNVSSVLGFVPMSLINPVYNGTKAWLHFWTVVLREQLKGTNVKVVELAPPSVGTDLHRERQNPDDNKRENNPTALTVDEFMEEVMGKWKKGDELITAGPGNNIMNTWEESMGDLYKKMAH